VKSFSDYERDSALGGSGDFNPNRPRDIHGRPLFSKKMNQLSISEIGRAADIAKCEAIKRALQAEKEIQSLKNAIKSWESRANPGNYKFNPKCQLNNFCRMKCPSEL